jgi:hypothetical protein
MKPLSALADIAPLDRNVRYPHETASETLVSLSSAGFSSS